MWAVGGGEEVIKESQNKGNFSLGSSVILAAVVTFWGSGRKDMKGRKER